MICERSVVEGMPSYGKLPEHDAFSAWRQWATHISWILPQHAQGLADNVEDSILAGQSGSFLFIDKRAKTLRRKYSLYVVFEHVSHALTSLTRTRNKIQVLHGRS